MGTCPSACHPPTYDYELESMSVLESVPANDAQTGIPPGAFFPMWLLLVSHVIQGMFLDSDGVPKPNEALKAQSPPILTKWSKGNYCIFVSHQWLSLKHPDPKGKQMSILREILKKMIDGTIKVTTDTFAQLVLQQLVSIGSDEQRNIETGYIWLDWASIPQIPSQFDTGGKPEMLAAVESIPAYVGASAMFLVLTPPLVHETGVMCNYDSWLLRGWCRTELCCRGMLSNAGPITVVTSAEKAEYKSSLRWVYHCPMDGSFSIPADAENMIKPILKRLFAQRIAHHQKVLQFGENHDQLVYYRWAIASKMRFTKCRIAKPQWLSTYRFDSLLDGGEGGLSPLMCAVVEGNVEMVQAILTHGANIDAKTTRAFPDISIKKGYVALHLGVMASSFEMVGILIKSKADIDTFDDDNMYSPLVATCFVDNPQIAELLLDNNAGLELGGIFDTTPLVQSGIYNAQKVAEVLLKRGANNRHEQLFGVDTLGNLSCFCENVTLARLLIGHRADLNKKRYATHQFAASIVKAAIIAVSGGSTSVQENLYAVIHGGTTLHMCAFNDYDKATKILLEAGADPRIKNDAGQTPAEVAKKYGHNDTCQMLLRSEKIWMHHHDVPTDIFV